MNGKGRPCYCPDCQWWRKIYWTCMTFSFIGICMFLAALYNGINAGMISGSTIFVISVIGAMKSGSKLERK